MGQCFPKLRLLSKLLPSVRNGKDDDDDEEDSDHHFDLAGKNVHLITTIESWEQKLSEAIRDDKIVIANFSASWCDPCQKVTPFYVDLSEKHPSIMFLLIDVDELTDFSTSWDLTATPTFIFLRNGQQFDKLVGANKPELQKKVTEILVETIPSSES